MVEQKEICEVTLRAGEFVASGSCPLEKGITSIRFNGFTLDLPDPRFCCISCLDCGKCDKLSNKYIESQQTG